MVLGSIPGTDIYRDVHHYKEAMTVPGFLVLSIEAPINFANSMYLNERVLRWIEELEAKDDMKKHLSIQYVILEMSGNIIHCLIVHVKVYILIAVHIL